MHNQFSDAIGALNALVNWARQRNKYGSPGTPLTAEERRARICDEQALGEGRDLDAKLGGLCDALGISIPNIETPGGHRRFGSSGLPYRSGNIGKSVFAPPAWFSAMETLQWSIETRSAQTVAPPLGGATQRDQSAPGQPQEVQPGGAANPPPLDYEDIYILKTLNNGRPLLMSIGQISGASHVSEKTVGVRLNRLIEEKLASRPNGPKRGAIITPEGVAVLEKLPPLALLTPSK
jgi:hypothetical protein